MQLTHKKLLGFIALSLLLHIVLFTGQGNYRVYVPEQAGSMIAVQLTTPQAPSTQPVATPVRTQKPTKTPVQKHTDRQTTDKPVNKQNQLNIARVLGEVRQKLSQHFAYPVLARRMGWQGQVLLGFQLDSAGSIHQVHVKHSSGYAILDNSAIAALNRIGKITVQGIDGFMGAWQLEIPIIYRLEG